MAITTRALAFASRWFDQATVYRTFEPLVADWQREWQDTASVKRQVVALRWLFAFALALVASLPEIARTSAPRSVTNRVVSRMAWFTLIASAVMSIPMLLSIPDSWWKGAMIFFALPGLLATAFPFSVVSAVDAIRCVEPLPPHVERAIAAKLAIVTVIVMAGYSGWVVPAANQAWRGAMAPAGINIAPRGIRELNTYELIVDPSRGSAGDTTNAGGRAALIRRELSTRASLAILPALLIWLRWGALDAPRRRWFSPLPPSLATVAAIAGFIALWFAGLTIEIERLLPYSLGMWVPTLGLIATGFMSRAWRLHTGKETL